MSGQNRWDSTSSSFSLIPLRGENIGIPIFPENNHSIGGTGDEKVLAEFEVALIALGARSRERAPQFSRSSP